MTWVLIDVSFLAYRALYSVGHMEHGDIPTGVAFGFFHQLHSVCTDPKVRSNKVMLFFDSKKSFRSDVYPDYKKKRRDDRTVEEKERIHAMWKQMKVLRRDVLPAIGIRCRGQRGLESDDLLAHASSLLKKKGERGVLITSDGDLYQCIHSACHWYDPQRRTYYNPQTFKVKKGIDPARWGDVKALGGCSSDNVAGIPGVGERTAIKYLLGELPMRYQAAQKIASENGRKIEKRNRELVVLPHHKTKPFDLEAPAYDVDAFFAICEEYGLRTFLERRKRWKSFFTHDPRSRLRGT